MFARGVAWDPYGEIRDVALSELAILVREEGDLDELAVIMGASADTEAEKLTRKTAVRALAAALGYDETTLPSSDAAVELGSEWSAAILARAKSRLESRMADPDAGK